MKKFRSLLLLSATFSISLIFLSSSRAYASDFSVVNTNDNGAGSLRQAITDANTAPGADTISFNISGVGLHTITPTSPLPWIADQTILDGCSQPGSNCTSRPQTLTIEIDGQSAGVSFGIAIDGPASANSIVRGLIINNFDDSTDVTGLLVNNSSYVTFESNYIGTNSIGSISKPNLTGIEVMDSNHITIGGTGPGQGNLISGNTQHGVGIIVNSSDITILGNYIGTSASGLSSLPNGAQGVEFTPITGINSNIVIGGTSSGSRNVISGNSGYGISGTSSSNIQILGNYIGVGSDGASRLSGQTGGISTANVSNITIGGANADSRNIISGNGVGGGVFLSGGTSGYTIQGNYIGLDASGLSLSNTGNGITLVDSGNGMIGGLVTEAANILANSEAGNGIMALGSSSQNISILRNSIYDNAAMGIDLNNDAVSLNDTADGDSGPNQLTNFPIIRSVNQNGVVTFDLDVAGSPSNTYLIEFFSNDIAEPVMHGEGKNYLGSATVSPGTNHEVTLTPLGAGKYLSATATAVNSSLSYGYGATSEFSGVAQLDGVIAGHIFGDINSNQIQDYSEPNLANISVTLTSESGYSVTVVTDVNGNYIASMPQGTVYVSYDTSNQDLPKDYQVTTTETGGTMAQSILVSSGSTIQANSVGVYSVSLKPETSVLNQSPTLSSTGKDSSLMAISGSLLIFAALFLWLNAKYKLKNSTTNF